MKRFFKIILIFALVIFVVYVFLSFAAGPNLKPEFGVTFSAQQAQNLGLDWKEVYTASLTDLNVKLIRLPVYWDKVEAERGKFNFEDVDYQLNLAGEHNAKVVLAIGKKVPRWPECFEPEWAKKLPSKEERDNALFSYIETVVVRYAEHPAVQTWQVENEPFLEFGECTGSGSDNLDKEIALVKKIDPSRPILVTDSGEINFWIKASARGDEFGTTMYRYVYSDVFKRYWVNYIPYWFYRVKGGMVKLLHPGKRIVIIELQAEPWTTKGITSTPVEEQFKTMSLSNFNHLVKVAESTGFSPQYFWGVEWWYWMKTKQDHPEFWERAKQLINNQ